MVSQVNALVTDATLISHPSGLQSVVWSQRNNQVWEVVVRNSNDGQVWNTMIPVVQNIAAPYFQEAAVHIAADALNQEEIALAFTGWKMQAYSQIWSKAFNAVTGTVTQTMAQLPDAGDMVVQPSLVTLANNTWAVAWQQKVGIDSEILVAQHHADGSWSSAVNVSVDPMHMDRDPHIALGSSKTLNIAFTRRLQADTQEVYTFSEGDILDVSLDSDGDGVADSQEIGFDLNHDGIDDSQSARVATWSNHEGRYALIMKGNGNLYQVQAPSFNGTHFEAPQTHQVSGSLFSFQIHALNIGESTQVHLVTPHTLAPDTTWLKLNPNAQWADSERENVYLDNQGTGLIINLTDGGSGDEDDISNGVIIDPAVLATPNAVTTNPDIHNISATQASDSQGGGCIMSTNPQSSWSWLLVMIITIGTFIANKRKQL